MNPHEAKHTPEPLEDFITAGKHWLEAAVSVAPLAHKPALDKNFREYSRYADAALAELATLRRDNARLKNAVEHVLIASEDGGTFADVDFDLLRNSLK